MKKKLVKITASALILSLGMSSAAFAEDIDMPGNEQTQQIDYEAQVIPEAEAVSADTAENAIEQNEMSAEAATDSMPAEEAATPPLSLCRS